MSQAIQSSINAAAEELGNAFENQKAAKTSTKELKKALKEKLESIPEYEELTRKEKELKSARKNISEELQDIKKEKEQIALETDEQKELDEFTEAEDIKFAERKDKVIAKLSRELADEGMIAEIHYKSGQLILIVARS